MTLTIKKENVKGLIKYYSLMLEKVAKTEVQKEFYAFQLEFHKKLLERIEENENISE
jgi:trans-aconitate methyltransferase